MIAGDDGTQRAQRDSIDPGQMGVVRVAERLGARPTDEHVVEPTLGPRGGGLIRIVGAPRGAGALAHLLPAIGQHEVANRGRTAAGEESDLVAVGRRVEVATHHHRRIAVGVAAHLVDDLQHSLALQLPYGRLVEAVVEMGADDRPRAVRGVDHRAERSAMTGRAVEPRQRMADDVADRPAADDGVVEPGPGVGALRCERVVAERDVVAEQGGDAMRR